MLEFEYDVELNGEDYGGGVPPLPAISATNAHEAGRIERLHSTFGHASATVRLMSARYQQAWDGAITALHDHKGALVVTWRDKVSRMMFEGAVMGAWENHCEHMGMHHLA